MIDKEFIIKSNKQYIDALDNKIVGISGGPLCIGCNPWLKKVKKEEIEQLKQMMRDKLDIEDFRNILKEKYDNVS